MKVAIIGGSGKMGRWFADFLSKEGKDVVITGRNEKKLLETAKQLGVRTATNVEAVQSADAVIIAVPIETFEAVVKEIAPHFRPEQLIFDVTSVKVLPVEIMHLHIKTGAILGTHPVFGPGAKGMAGQNFVLTPTDERETALAQKAQQYLEARGARVALMTPQEHDEMMAVVLGIAHFIAIASADTLSGFENLKLMESIGGTTFRLLLTLVESVISEAPELYASIQMNLPHISEIEAQFQQSVSTWADIVKRHDRQEFIKRMTAIRQKLENSDPDFHKAYQNMYRLVDK